MSGYLVAEEGPLAGAVVSLLEEKASGKWTLGRDSDLCDVLLEDPMVSRKHAIISLTPEGFLLENLSSVNPVTQNGKLIVEPVLLKEADILQIGTTFFRFTEKAPIEEEFLQPEKNGEPSIAQPIQEAYFSPIADARWLLKVLSGPNAGAEFAMRAGTNYLIGKDPNTCDIIFQDLSVSRQHARLSIDADENAFIEDLGSRNGVIVNGELIADKHMLASQDLVALGTTTFLVVDRKQARETIVSPPSPMMIPPLVKEESRTLREKRDWRELVIPKRHLVLAGIFASVLFVSLFAMFSLFKVQPIVVRQADESKKIEDAIEKFPFVHFSFNPNSGRLFLTGHVLTAIDKQEVLYLLKQFSFVGEIEDNLIVDELVWKNTNDLLSTNPNWGAVSVYSTEPGKFVVRGYVQTIEQQQALQDYITLHFPYLDKLENQVIVEKNLQTEIQKRLTEKNYSGIAFQLSNGEVVFAGRVEESKNSEFQKVLQEIKKLSGVRVVKNFVIITTADTSRIDLSDQYAITGYSKRDDKDYFVVINGRILGEGDMFDGMLITQVASKSVFLEKDGLKYRINYNLQ